MIYNHQFNWVNKTLQRQLYKHCHFQWLVSCSIFKNTYNLSFKNFSRLLKWTSIHVFQWTGNSKIGTYVTSKLYQVISSSIAWQQDRGLFPFINCKYNCLIFKHGFTLKHHILAIFCHFCFDFQVIKLCSYDS